MSVSRGQRINNFRVSLQISHPTVSVYENRSTHALILTTENTPTFWEILVLLPEIGRHCGHVQDVSMVNVFLTKDEMNGSVTRQFTGLPSHCRFPGILLSPGLK